MVYVITAGLPCLILILSLFSRFCSGPFWLGANNDPTYLYFMNSLYLADHKIPTFTQHPGTPLQILGALVIKILSFPSQGQAMVEDALRRPEYYLSGMYGVLIAFYIITLFLLGWYAWGRTKNFIVVLLLQSPAFLYLTMYKSHSSLLPMLANVCAESLLVGFLNIYLICLVHAFFMEKGRSLVWTGVGWGITCGLMMATKFICFPLLLIPFCVVDSYKARLNFVLAMVTSFLVATMPIWPRYPMLFSWLTLLVTHQEPVGNGPAGFIAWPHYLKAIIAIFKWQWLLMMSAVFALGLVFIRSFSGPSGGKKARWYAACIAGTIVLQFLMVAKEPQDHYMVPAVGLFGGLWAFIYCEGGINPRIWNSVVTFFIFVSTILSIDYMHHFYVSSREMMNFSQEIYSRFDQCIISGFYRSSSLPFALDFGDDNAGRKAYGETIQKLYRQHYFMAILEKRFDDAKGIVYAEDLLAQSPCVLLYGTASGLEKENSPLLTIQLLKQQGSEALYRVVGARDKEARQLFYMAQIALMQGQGQAAYALGLRSQALGLPQAHDFIAQMDEIINHSKAGK